MVFFSHDGESVGFGDNRQLKKVRLEAGTVTALAEAPDPNGASWGDDDTILYSPTDSGLFRVSSSGGARSAVTAPDAAQGEISHRWPQFLPGSKAAIFTIRTGFVETSRIAALRLETGEYRVLVEGASSAQYAGTGHLVYYRQGGLEAAPFDPNTLEVKGPPRTFQMGVRALDTVGHIGGAHFSISRNGDLAYVPGTVQPGHTLVWVDRNGLASPLTEERRRFEHPRLSPDGKRLAITILDEKSSHIWIYDLERGGFTRLSEPGAGTPIWTPDGQRVVYLKRTNTSEIVWQAADGSDGAGILTALASGDAEPSSWSPDGRLLSFTDMDPHNGYDLWLLSVEDAPDARPFLRTPARELGGVFSPDGQWIAYESNESGRHEIYVRPFPGPGGKWQVSTEGGVQPVWARDGKEIFFRSGDRMMAVDVETKPSLRFSKPKVLFEGRYAGAAGWWGYANYDVTPDGQRFVMIGNEEESVPARIRVILNWAEELREKVPEEP